MVKLVQHSLEVEQGHWAGLLGVVVEITWSLLGTS